MRLPRREQGVWGSAGLRCEAVREPSTPPLRSPQGQPRGASGATSPLKMERPDRSTGRAAIDAPEEGVGRYPRNIWSDAAVHSTIGAHQMPNTSTATENAPRRSW